MHWRLETINPSNSEWQLVSEFPYAQRSYPLTNQERGEVHFFRLAGVSDHVSPYLEPHASGYGEIISVVTPNRTIDTLINPNNSAEKYLVTSVPIEVTISTIGAGYEYWLNHGANTSVSPHTALTADSNIWEHGIAFSNRQFAVSFGGSGEWQLWNGPGADLVVYGSVTEFDIDSSDNGNEASANSKFNLSNWSYYTNEPPYNSPPTVKTIGREVRTLDLSTLGVPEGATVETLYARGSGQVFGFGVISDSVRPMIDLSVEDVADSDEYSTARRVPVNSNFDEGNTDGNGDRVPDNDSDSTINQYFDLQLVPVRFEVKSNAPVKSRMKLEFPENIRVWREDWVYPYGMLEVESGTAFDLDPFTQVMGNEWGNLWIEGITPTAADEEIELKASLLLPEAADDIGIPVDTIRLRVQGFDIAVDSNNDGTIDTQDDADEDSRELPGKWIQLNTRDYDADGVPAYSDGLTSGYSTNSLQKTDSGQRSDFVFSELQVTLPEGVDVDQAGVQLVWKGVNGISEPLVTDGNYPLGNQPNVRFWTNVGGSAFKLLDHQFSLERKAGSITPDENGGYGHLIDQYYWHRASDLGFTDDVRTVTIFMEGAHSTFKNGYTDYQVSIDPDYNDSFYDLGDFAGPGFPFPDGRGVYSEIFRVTVIDVDVDFGDRVTGAIHEDGLSDEREELTGFAPLLPINDGNSDYVPYLQGGTPSQNSDYFNNQANRPIPDFLDGYQSSGISPSQASASASARFTPMQIKLSEGIDLSKARIRILYDAALPGATPSSVIAGDPKPYSGSSRIWTKNGDITRSAAYVSSGGDYVETDVWYTAAELNINTTTRKGILYVEGIALSEAGNAIRVEVDPEGLEGEYFVASDVVKANVGKHLITGQVQYLIKDLAEKFPSPVRHAAVWLQTQNRIYVSHTNDAGEFVIQIDDPSEPVLSLQIRTDSRGSGDGRAVVVEAFDMLARWKDASLEGYMPTGSSSRVHVDLTGASAINADQSQVTLKAFQAFDALVAAAVYSESLTNAPDATTFAFIERPASETGKIARTDQVNHNIFIPMDYAANWDVVQHEYGHALAYDIGFAPYFFIGSVGHEPNQNIRGTLGLAASYTKANTLAFSEGWANFFASLAQAEGYTPSQGQRITAIDGPKFLGADFEHEGPDEGVGEDEEITVARVLWDLYDNANDSGDNVAIAPNVIVNSLMQITNNIGEPTLRLLWFALTASETSFASIQEFAPIFVAAGAAPEGVGITLNGEPAAAIPIGSVKPAFQWETNLTKGKGITTPTDIFDSYKIIIFDGNGSVVREYSPEYEGYPAVESSEILDWDLPVGQYYWSVSGNWLQAGSGSFLSKPLSFTVTVPEEE